jgi:NDP-sugar pyrophosphorylase family protein
MKGPEMSPPGRWLGHELPSNALVGAGSLITGEHAFRRFLSLRPSALTLGEHCTMDEVQFILGREAEVAVGDCCYFSYVYLMSELELRIGSYVIIGWGVHVTDTDFHPIGPVERIADAIACSPLGAGRARAPLERRRVTIGDDVWIGPKATILKGVSVGTASVIEPGSMVTRDVPSGSRVAGNPARIVGAA